MSTLLEKPSPLKFSKQIRPTQFILNTEVKKWDWEDAKVRLLFWVGRYSPELFDLLLRWMGRRKEERQVCLLFWLAVYSPSTFERALCGRRWLQSFWSSRSLWSHTSQS